MTNEQAQQLARVETKLDLLITEAADQETRIRGLEKWRWYSSGAVAVLGAVLAWLKYDVRGML